MPTKTISHRVVAMLRSERAKQKAFALAEKLPPKARQTFLRFARAGRDVVLQPPAPKTAIARSRLGAGKPPPKRFRVSPAPEPITGDWPEAPFVEVPGAPVRSLYTGGRSEPRYDVELFEALNAEYESKPIVPTAQGKDTASRADRARKRLTMIHDSIGLKDKRVLEVGCGAGYEVWYLAHHVNADAYGVDVVERAAWSVLADDRTHYECADITQKNPFEENFFDRIMSFSVWEHITHPYKALEETFKIMKPGGLAWISANLYRSAVASHQYHNIYFPFPHLLFSDDVFKEFYRRRGEKERGASWVNKVTWSQYEQYFAQIGFRTKMLHFSERPLDEEFYTRFEDVLGRYPRFDLTRDFFNVVLEKP